MTRIIRQDEINAIAQSIAVATLYVASIAGMMYQIGSAAGFIV